MGKVHVKSGSLLFPEARRALSVEHGSTLAEIVRIAGLPERLDAHAVVALNDTPIPRAQWPRVKPKAGTFVSIGVKAADGDTMRMLLPFAATMAAGATGIGGVGGWLLQAGVYVVSTFIGSALWPPKQESEGTQLSIAAPGNATKPNGTVPRVYGRMRVYPPMCAAPVTEIIGREQYVKMLFCLGYAPLRVSDLRIGDMRIGKGGKNGITVAMSTGYDDSAYSPIETVFNRDAHETRTDKKLDYYAGWETEGWGGRVIYESIPPEVAAYETQPETTAIAVDFNFPEGLYREQGDSVFGARVNLKIRYRLKSALPYYGESLNISPWQYVEMPTEAPDISRVTDTELYQRLEKINDGLALLINILTVGGALGMAVSAILKAAIRKRISGLHGSVTARIAEDEARPVLTVYQRAQLGDALTRLEDLNAFVEGATEVINDAEAAASLLHRILSVALEVIEFADNAIHYSHQLAVGYGQALETLPWYLQIWTHWRGLEWIFGPAPDGAFTVHTQNNSKEPYRFTAIWPVPEGQYEVQVANITPPVHTVEWGRETDTVDDTVHNEVHVTAIRSFRSAPPISNAAKNRLAFVALRVKATEAFNNTLDAFNCIAEAPIQWSNDGLTFHGPDLERYTNPAWIAFNMLTGSAVLNPVPLYAIDMPRLMEFASHCRGNGYRFSGVFDDKITLQEALRLVCRVAKASPIMRDGKISVVMDRPPVGEAVPVSAISPRNCANYAVSRSFEPRPRCYEAKFMNQYKNWKEDVIRVYDDSDTGARFTDDTYPNTLPKPVEITLTPGFTYPEDVDRFCRYLIACAKLRPEAHECLMDVENIVFERGNVLRIQHDVPLWGSGSARVRTVDADAKTITIDDDPTLWQWTAQTRVLIRHSDGLQYEADATLGDDNRTIALTWTHSTAMGDAVSAGDLVLFSSAPFEICMVRDIRPSSVQTATVTLVPYAPEVHTSGAIPPYDTNITQPYTRELTTPPTPAIVEVVTDERALVRRADGVLESRIEIHIQKPPALDHDDITGVQVQKRKSESRVGPKTDEARGAAAIPWESAQMFPADADKVSLSGVADGVFYDVRLRFVTRRGLPSDWASVFHVMCYGKTMPPPDVTGLYWENGVLTWAYVAPLDHAGFQVRQFVGRGGTWETATPAHDGNLTAASFDATRFSNGRRTFFVKAVDTSGNLSRRAASVTNDFGHWKIDAEYGRISAASLMPTEEDSGVLTPGLPAYRPGAPFYVTTYGRQIVNIGSVNVYNIRIGDLAWQPKPFNARVFPDVEIDPECTADWTLEVKDEFGILWPADLTAPLWPSRLSDVLWPDMEWRPITDKFSVPARDRDALLASDWAMLRFRIVAPPGNAALTVTRADIVFDAPWVRAQFGALPVTAAIAFAPTVPGLHHVMSVQATLPGVDGQSVDAARVLTNVYEKDGDNNPIDPVIGLSLVDASGVNVHYYTPSQDGYADITVVGF